MGGGMRGKSSQLKFKTSSTTERSKGGKRYPPTFGGGEYKPQDGQSLFVRDDVA